MSLLTRLTQDLHGAEGKALAGLGTIFGSVRLALDNAAFATVRQHLPDVDDWIRRGAGADGRTAELFSLVAPEALPDRLEQAGYTADEMHCLGRQVGTALRGALPQDSFASLTERIELLAV